MSFRDRWIDLLYRAATGTRKTRVLLTPIGLTVFGLFTTLFVLAGLLVDKLLGLPDLLPERMRLSAAIPHSRLFMLWFDSLVLIPIAAIAYLVLRRLPPERRLTTAFWLAFYFTVPLTVYDWLYCGLYLGHGVQFIPKYWYLTVYYAIPWILLPLMALLLNHTRSGVKDDSS